MRPIPVTKNVYRGFRIAEVLRHRKRASDQVKSFGQVFVAARKAAGLTQKSVADSLRREDGRRVLPPFLNDLEHDRRYPPENAVIEHLAKILKLSSDVLYFYPQRIPPDIRSDATDTEVAAAYKGFRQVLANRGSRRSFHSSRALSAPLDDPQFNFGWCTVSL
jgi:transcriptional regulator with XRE-family HTH domain